MGKVLHLYTTLRSLLKYVLKIIIGSVLTIEDALFFLFPSEIKDKPCFRHSKGT